MWKYTEQLQKELNELVSQGWRVSYTDGSTKRARGWMRAANGVLYGKGGARNFSRHVPAHERHRLSSGELHGIPWGPPLAHGRGTSCPYVGTLGPNRTLMKWYFQGIDNDLFYAIFVPKWRLSVGSPFNPRDIGRPDFVIFPLPLKNVLAVAAADPRRASCMRC